MSDMSSYIKKIIKNADNELRTLLEQVPDTYDDFIFGIVDDVNKGKYSKSEVVNYIKTYPEATTSDIIDYTDDLLGIPRL